MSKSLHQTAQGVDVSPLLTAAARHKMWLLRLHADGAIQSREAVKQRHNGFKLQALQGQI